MRVAVLGAGITGLIAALQVKEANLPDVTEVAVLEEKSYPGGLLQTTRHKQYWWDNGVFLFRGSNYLNELLPDLFRPLELVQKVWLRGALHEFPLAKDLFWSQRKTALAWAACDYIYSYARTRLGWDGANLHDWLRYRLTNLLLKVSQLEVYIEKMQGNRPGQLSPLFGEHRLQGIHDMTRPDRLFRIATTSPRQMKRIIMQRDPDTYPFVGGVGKISEGLAQLCMSKGITIAYGAELKELIRRESGLELHYQHEMSAKTLTAAYVISTVPIEVLAAALNPPMSKRCQNHIRELSYMDLRLVFLIVNRKVIVHDFFVLYSFEPQYKWKRLLAFSLPDGHTAVTVEIAYRSGTGKGLDGIDSEVVRQLTEDLKLFEPSEVLEQHTTTVQRAYPIYRLGFEKKLKEIISELESERLRLAGRQGRFIYVTTPGAVGSGIEQANKVLSSIRRGRNA